MAEDDNLGNNDSGVNGEHWRGWQRQVMMVGVDNVGVDGRRWRGRRQRTKTCWAMTWATRMVGLMADVGGVDNGGQGQWELRMSGSTEDGGRVNAGG